MDPARDTPAKVKEYVREFHPRLIGLTGSEEAVKACSKAYRCVCVCWTEWGSLVVWLALRGLCWCILGLSRHQKL